MRNWYYFTWLSGDFIVEQHCHNFDKANWVLKGEDADRGHRRRRPAGRARDAKFGNIYDHFAVHAGVPRRRQAVLALPADGRLPGDVNDHVFGTKGSGPIDEAHRVDPTGGKTWEFDGRR